MPRGPRTAEQLARENAQARARRAAGYVRPPRSEREREQSRDRARVRGRVKLGWLASRLPDPPAIRVTHHKPKTLVGEVRLPQLALGHPLFERARSLLRGWELSDFSTDMDTVAADMISEFVLAELEGHDGEEALREFRRRHGKDRKILIYGTAMVDGLER